MKNEDEKTTFKDAEATRESPKALYCTIHNSDGKGTRSLWVPKSVIHDDSEVFDAADNNKGKLVLKQWFVEKENLG